MDLGLAAEVIADFADGLKAETKPRSSRREERAIRSMTALFLSTNFSLLRVLRELRGSLLQFTRRV
jgi:hypothetical protein